MITLQNIGEALKTHYLPTCQYQLNEEADEFVAEISKDATNIEADKAVFGLKYGRNGGIGNRADDGDLPTPSSRSIKQGTLITRNIFARVSFTHKIMLATKSKLASFVQVLNDEMEDAMTDAKDSFGRQVHGNSKGILATLAGTADNATQTVSDLTALAIGMVVDVVAVNGTVKYTAKRIIDVDYDNSQVVFDSAPGGATASTDVLVVSGSYGYELTGLKEIFDNTTTSLYGITRATNKWINPIVKAVNGEIDELTIQAGIDTASRRAGSKVDFIVTDDGTARAYQYMQQVYKRNIEMMELKGGRKTMSYNGIPITTTKYCEKSSMYLLAKKDFKIHRLADWDWLADDGAVLHRVANKAAYEASLCFYGDLGCARPGGQVKLTGITAH